jgi:dTDP-glucose 4,6-dehydratase
MKILITGANGFIGANIVYECIRRGYTPTCVIHKNSNNLPSDVEIVKHDLRFPFKTTCVYDFIIHAAADSSAKSCIDNPTSAIENNILATFNILEYALINKTPLIFFSSCEVYGDCDGDTTENSPLNTTNMYGASKISCEYICKAYNKTHGLPIVIFRLLHTYGPFVQPERFAGIIQSKIKSEKIPHFILHNNHKKRWIHSTDMARKVFIVMDTFMGGFEIFNLVGDYELTMIEFIELFTKEYTYEFVPYTQSGYLTSSNVSGEKLNSFILSHT